MCRLLGFATADSNTNLNGVLGMQNVRDFRNLSEIHNDGWGAALITVPTSYEVLPLLSLRYRALGGNDDAQPKGVVVASSGFDQRAEDGWTRLENDQMIVASNRTGEFRVRSI